LAASVVALLATTGMAGAQVALASPTLSSTSDETWQTNEKVYSVVGHGDHIYVGGKSTNVLSPAESARRAAPMLARRGENYGGRYAVGSAAGIRLMPQ
jgi:hypothetical protein